MNKRTHTFLTDDLPIEYHIYRPDQPNNVLISIAHGMAEHKERYDDVCRYLCNQGYLVVIHDHRGHGKSTNEQHKWGDMGTNGFEKVVDDMHSLIILVQKEFQSKQLIVLGHSMGSLLARRYLMRYEQEVDGLVLVGTPSSSPILGAAMVLTKLIMTFKGETYQSPLLQKLAFGPYQKPFEYRTGFEWLNQDPAAVDQYMADEAFTFSARAFFALFDGIRTIYGPYPAPQKPNLPILFLSGEKDPCGEMTVGVKRAEKHLADQGYRNVKTILYPSMRHEILLERDHQKVYQDLMNFASVISDQMKNHEAETAASF